MLSLYIRAPCFFGNSRMETFNHALHLEWKPPEPRPIGSSTQYSRTLVPNTITVDSRKLENGRGRIYSGVPSFLGLGLEDGHVPPFGVLL